MEDIPHQHDIPIWFNGTQRWMTGLTKRTTCDDIIYAILYSTGLHESESTDNFAIFEKWREVERPLSARTKILKIWATWGQDQASVQLSMRSLDDYFLPGESSLYLRSRRRHRKTSRHKGRHGTSCRCHNKRGCDECSRLKPLEQLVKLVVSHETFLLIGGCYAVLQLIGSLLICNPPPKEITIIIPSAEDTTKASLPEERYVKLPDQLPALELQPKVDPTTLDEKKSQADEEEQIDNVISEKPANNDQEDHNVYPLKMLKDKNFYLLWIIFLFNGQGVTFISSLYKAYGQTFISDDSFLALVGAFAAVFNASGRIVWGVIADKFSFRVALLALLGVFTSLMLTLQVSEYGGKPLFFVYICLLFGSFSGNFSLFPTATAKSYGPKYLSINYGLLFTSQLVTAPLGTFLSQMLKASIGWNGLFFLVAGFTFSSLLLTILFSGKDKKGNTI